MKSDGFTLMELMIVMAIISIMAAIAIPTYKHYTERARFTGVIIASEPYKTAVALALQEGIDVKDINNDENGVPPSPKADNNLKNIVVKNSVITSTASKAGGGYTYILTPNSDGSQWQVSGSCIKAGLCKQ